MGGRGSYIASGGFTKTTYRTVGTTSNGIKVIEKIDEKNSSSNTPLFSNTSTVYAIAGTDDKIKQVTLYENRKKKSDIDIGHVHGDFNKKDIHVHDYSPEGIRNDEARRPTEAELKLVKEIMEKEYIKNGNSNK